MKPRFLLENDLTERDIDEMLRWNEIMNFEVQRIANVLDYWRNEVKPKRHLNHPGVTHPYPSYDALRCYSLR